MPSKKAKKFGTKYVCKILSREVRLTRHMFRYSWIRGKKEHPYGVWDSETGRFIGYVYKERSEFFFRQFGWRQVPIIYWLSQRTTQQGDRVIVKWGHTRDEAIARLLGW